VARLEMKNKSLDYVYETDDNCVAGFYLFSHLASDVSFFNRCVFLIILTALMEKYFILVSIFCCLSP